MISLFTLSLSVQSAAPSPLPRLFRCLKLLWPRKLVQKKIVELFLLTLNEWARHGSLSHFLQAKQKGFTIWFFGISQVF